MKAYLCVALGGALGAVSRYAIGNLPYVAGSPHFKTLAINIAGCLVIGIAWAVIEAWPVSRLWYNTIIAGFLGGFTTYSSFSLETMRMLGEGRAGESLLYVFLTVAGCLGACALGLFGTERLIKLI